MSSTKHYLCSVCIATYRRPRLLDKLLISLEAQRLPNHIALEVIVVDNDAERSAASVVSSHRDTKRIAFSYLVQPRKNISLTRNMAVANAKGEYLLFIDDDETATPFWVAALLEAAELYRADGVFGLLVPAFDEDAPDWIKKGQRRLLGAMPNLVTGAEAVKTWTGNCLMTARILEGIPGPFNPEYGNTGGEDTELFNKLKQRGARFIYCSEARVFEYFPPERTRLSYLLRRGLQGGNSHTRRTIAASERKRLLRSAMLLKSVVFGCVSLGLSIIMFPSTIWRTYWQMKLAANAGRFLAVVGRQYKSYG